MILKLYDKDVDDFQMCTFNFVCTKQECELDSSSFQDVKAGQLGNLLVSIKICIMCHILTFVLWCFFRNVELKTLQIHLLCLATSSSWCSLHR